MKKVLILYGWHGSDAPHWQAWLKEELEKDHYEVSFPQLSNNMNPDKPTWLAEASQAFKALKPDIVITHSLGNILWFHLCNEGLVEDVQHLLLVAPPRDLSDYEEVKSFFPVTTPQRLCAKEGLLVCSDNDPYMELSQSQELAQSLDCDIKVLNNGGHINSDSGFGPWPWVLEWVRNK